MVEQPQAPTPFGRSGCVSSSLSGEQATLFLADPSGNALEFKAFGDDDDFGRGGPSSAVVGSSGTAGPRVARLALLKQSARRAAFEHRWTSRGRDFCTTARSRHHCSVGNLFYQHRNARFELDCNLAVYSATSECTRTKQRRPFPIGYAPARPLLRRGRDSSRKRAKFCGAADGAKQALELVLSSRTYQAND